MDASGELSNDAANHKADRSDENIRLPDVVTDQDSSENHHDSKSLMEEGNEGKNIEPRKEDLENGDSNSMAINLPSVELEANICDTNTHKISPNQSSVSTDTTSENQNDSALCISPKSLMDTSCDKLNETEIDDGGNPQNIRKDDSGICFDKTDLEEDNDVTKTDYTINGKPVTENTNNTLADNMLALGESPSTSNTKVPAPCPSGSHSQDENNVNSCVTNGNLYCDKQIEDEVKSIDLDSDDWSDDHEHKEVKQKDKDKTKRKKAEDDSDDSDTSGPNTYEVNSTKENEDKKVKSSSKSDSNSPSDDSDIEQEMDALDLFLSHRKKRRDSNHSSQSNDDDDNDDNEDAARRRRNRNRSSANVDDDDDEDTETKSHDSDHSDSDTEIDTTPPPDSWRPLKEIRAREIGYGNKTYAPERFRTRLGSSINLAQRLKRNCKLESHEGCVNALHFNKSGTLLASGSDDLNIVVWDWLKGKPYFVFDSGHRSNVFQCKFMPYTGDCHIVSCARDGQIRLAELSSTGICKGTKKLAQHRGAAHKLSLLEDSSHVFYSCGEDAVVYSVDLREEKPVKLCTTKENDKKIPLYSIHSNPMKSFEYCVGGRDHFLRIYDKRMNGGDGTSDNVLKKFCPHHLVNSEIKANVTCAVFSWDGEEVLGTYNDEDIYLFDSTHSDGAEYIHKYKGHRNNATVKGINFYGPRSEFVVSGSDCGNVYLWEKKSEKIVNYFHADEGGVVNVLEPHPHMPVLATSGLDHDVKIWMPLGGEATKMDGLAKRIKKNLKERDRERINEPEMLDGRMLWFLMHHLRRTRRRPTGDGDSSTDSDDVERGGGGDTEASDDDDEPMQCAPS